MYCRKCGKQIKDGENFCRFCGAPVIRVDNSKTQSNQELQQRPVMQQKPVMQQVPPYNPQSSQKNVQREPKKTEKKSPLVAAAVIVVAAAVAVGGVGTMWYLGVGPFAKTESVQSSEKKKAVEKDTSEDKSEKQDTVNQDTDSETHDNDTEQTETDQDTVDSNENTPSFDIDSSTETDYSNVTDLSDYDIYQSPYSDHFSFYYPTKLYEAVDYRVDPDASFDFMDTFDGKNIEYINFSGNDGSNLIYQMVQVTGDGSVDEIADSIEDTIYNEAKMKKPTTLLKKKKDGNAYVVVTGKTPDNFVKYIACTAYPNSSGAKMMIMEMVFHDYYDKDDKSHKWYYNEVIYRGLGFGYSDAGVRSYDEFLEDYKG